MNAPIGDGVRRVLKLPWFSVAPSTRPSGPPPEPIAGSSPDGREQRNVEIDRPTSFDDASLRRLERLRVVARRQHGSVSFGGRRSRQRGTSIEFADYREYAFGDDPRSIDWNVYGRSDRLFVKLREDEESLAVYLFVDCSRSMDWGISNKLAHARRLATAIGYAGLCGADTVTGVGIAERILATSATFRGRPSFGRLSQFFRALTPGWKTDLAASLRAFASGQRPRGLAVVISDLLSSRAHEGLGALTERGYEVVVLHVIDQSETEPDLDGDIDLYDRETGAVVRVSADASLAYQYRERVGTWLAEQEAQCNRRQIRYIPVTTSVPVEEFLFHDPRARRVIA